MKLFKRLSLIALCLCMLVGTFAMPVSVMADEAADEAYKQSLKDKGFTEDYIEPLLALHKKYSQWEFEPLLITEISRQQGKETEYTWDYVIHMEYADSIKRNLCARSAAQTLYRDFSHTVLYDSGWYKASRAAVEYEMDTRNFLGEKSIFRYLDLRWSDGITLEAVQAALRGTFMENTKLDGEYSNTTYAEFFYKVGKEVGVNPVFLASRIRQEQGTGKSALISGYCGDKMWYYYDNGSGKYSKTDENGNLINAPTSGYTQAGLQKYNGYYNYFNMGSAGTGYFEIYMGGMNEAIQGTPEMASKWGGSPSWNTRWKALYGGTMKVKAKYIDVYQNIPYLQKFNVDARSSKNFWGQYMQNVTAATSEGNTMYRAYSENNFLDTKINFVIPIYEGMPKEKCKTPDGTEFVEADLLKASNIDSYFTYDLMNISREDGLVREYADMGIKWRTVVCKPADAIALGRINLSKYDQIFIDYSTDGDFKATSNGKPAYLGITADPNGDYTDKNAYTVDYCNLKSGNGDDLYRRVAKLNVKSDDIGDVYLAVTSPSGENIYIHNIIFVTKTGHTGTVEDPNAPETNAPTTDAPAVNDPETDASATEQNTETNADESDIQANAGVDTSSGDNNGGGNDMTVWWIVIAVVVIIAVGGNIVLFTVLKKKK